MSFAGPLTADAVHAVVRAELDVVDAAYARLRATCTDLAGNAFRIEVAERLEAQLRTNRGLSYRMFGEIAAPVDGPDDPRLPAGVKVRDVLASRLRLTAGEVRRRFRVAARIRPRRSLTGPPIAPELPELAAAVEAGEVGDDHIAAVCRALDVLPASVSPADKDKAERTLVRHAREQDSQFVAVVGADHRRLPEPRRQLHRRGSRPPARAGAGTAGTRRHEPAQRLAGPGGPRVSRGGRRRGTPRPPSTRRCRRARCTKPRAALPRRASSSH